MLNSLRGWFLRHKELPKEFKKIEKDQRDVVASIKEKRLELEAAIEQLKQARIVEKT